jgi:hypothetical protein
MFSCAVLVAAAALLLLHAGNFGRFRPQGDVRGDHGGEFLGTVAERVNTEAG